MVRGQLAISRRRRIYILKSFVILDKQTESKNFPYMELQIIQNKIFEIRGMRVMLDFDLAEMYDVETRILN